MKTLVSLTERERLFVLGAVRNWAGRSDPFGQALIAKLSRPEASDNCRKGAVEGADDLAMCEDLGE